MSLSHPWTCSLLVLARVVVHSLYNWTFTYMIIAILLVGRWNLKVVLISISQLSRDDELCSFFLSFFLYKYLLSFVVLVCLFVWELTLNFKFLMRPKSGLFWCLLRSCYFLPSDAEYASLANTINSHILHIFRSVGDCMFYKMPMLPFGLLMEIRGALHCKIIPDVTRSYVRPGKWHDFF